MDINCPYCGAHYELDDLLLPEGNIKVKCRVCSNVFILNKSSGAFKDEPPVSAETQIPITQTSIEPEHSPSPASGSVSDDFMQSIISEINSAVAEEAGGKHKEDSGSDAVSAPSSSSGKVKGRTTPFQIAILIVLIVVFLIAAASALVHYNIINIPFLPSGVSDFLSSL